MGHSEIDVIRTRVERLEREGRRWRAVAAGAVAILCLVAMTGAAGRVADEVRTRSFALVDADGADRAVIAMSKDGSPTLVLYDAGGKRRLSLGVSLKNYRGVPEVWLADEKGDTIWKKRR